MPLWKWEKILVGGQEGEKFGQLDMSFFHRFYPLNQKLIIMYIQC